ncbi:MAG: SN-glycerol-3-phosphate transport ATP-binding protein UgpC [Nitrospira sp.]|jgi:ABC-type sugar transport system ATPase subunit|nr:MAG: SN-glycerol-3-phosphate transport ATP-binding protein UgpC [Nitrospira sp.]
MAELELRTISKSFRDQTVLHDVSLRVPDGIFTILLGPSGCGKSTLLRIIAGLELQTSGQVLIDGAAVDHLAPAERDIAMVFQQYALYPHLSVRDNLAFALTIRRTPRHVIDDRIAEVAQLLEIHQLLDRKPKDLSGGQRQRVAMGRAIVRKPKLFLFDEPLSNLDAQLRTSMRIELKKLQQRLQATMVYVTHDQVEAMTLGDRIILLDRGRIRQVGPPRDIYAAPANPFVASFIGTPPMNLWKGTITRQDHRIVFRSEDLSLPLPPLPPEPAPESAVTLGIRPEDIRLEDETDALRVVAVVDLIEDLGADLLLHCTVGRLRLVVRAVRAIDQKPGRFVTLSLPLNKLHLFFDDRRLDKAFSPPS